MVPQAMPRNAWFQASPLTGRYRQMTLAPG